MEAPTEKSAYAILYEQKRWTWDEMHSVHLEFHPDGRGHIWWCDQPTYILVVTLDWEITGSLETTESIDTAARQLGQFDIKIKLNREPTGGGPQNPLDYLDKYYTAAAYEPKHFKITIEQGNFRTPLRAGSEVQSIRLAEGTNTAQRAPSNDLAEQLLSESETLSERYRYAYRLVFNQSPFPPMKDWKPQSWDLKHPQYLRYTDPEIRTEFVAQRLPHSANGELATNAAWQREMVRIWDARPLTGHRLEMAKDWIESQEKSARLRARLDRKKARDQAKLEEAAAQEQAKAEEATEQSKTEE